MERETLTDRSTVDLVRRASEQISTLVRDEIQLARAEMAQKGKQAGIGAGLFGTAAMLALYGIAAVLTAVILAVALALPAWAAALIVGAALLIIAGIVALAGRSTVRQIGPAAPQSAIDSVRADVDAITNAARNHDSRAATSDPVPGKPVPSDPVPSDPVRGRPASGRPAPSGPAGFTGAGSYDRNQVDDRSRR